jgi:catechol 2,3-dioxygenase-like lactoylglutathione lyase family enzyme
MTDAAAPSGLIPTLDHVVVLVYDQLDAMQAAYERLGFQLTPRGHHSLGSSNNLAIFRDNYFELLGFEAVKDRLRPELWQDPAGLTAIVFRPTSPEEVAQVMHERGVGAEEPVTFTRPVDTPDGSRDARFTIVRVPPRHIQNGRSFFCYHHTPKLVWRPEWQAHPNGATNVVEFVISAPDPRKTAAVYDAIFGPGLLVDIDGGVGFRAGAAKVRVLEPAAARARFGDAILPDLEAQDRMVALGIGTTSIDAATACLTETGVPFTKSGCGRILVSHDLAGGVAIEFCEEATT